MKGISSYFKAGWIFMVMWMTMLSLNAQSDSWLRLRGGDRLVTWSEYPVQDFRNFQQDEIVEGRLLRIALFNDIPDQISRNKLLSSGVIFLDYLPDRAYFLSIPLDASLELLVSSGIQALMPLDAGITLHPDLAAGQYPDWSLPDNVHIDILVNFAGIISTSAIEQLVRTIGAQLLPEYGSDHVRALRLDRARLNEIAELPFVIWVEPIYPPSEPENYTARTLHRSNMLEANYPGARHYDGWGVDVMLQDDGIIGPHIDFDGRIGSQNISSNSGDHGDHIAGTIMGAGNLDPRTRGMAPGATIHTFGASPSYPGFVNMNTYYNSLNIRITSTSYSNGCNAGYTTLARTLDQQLRTLPALMHVFSAGNDGTSNCGYGAGSNWGNITGGHKMAKNAIAVANLDYKDALSNSSSRGPAHDGRIKPDISAKGSSVYSTTNPNLYTTKSGTSMACPGVSGTLAQLYHAFRDLNNGSDPAGALMKAVVLNSADDLDNPGPDFKTGWGRLNALRAVKTIEDQRYMMDSVQQGDTNHHTITVPEGVVELRVMVYWPDFEAFSGVSKSLVNDINTRLLDTMSTAYLPWLLDHTPTPLALNTPAGKGVDSVNNVEQIVISNPLPGDYRLEVIGKMIPQGPQAYYVVYEFMKNEVVLTYPSGGEAFAPGESITIRWDAPGTGSTFMLEFSEDDGANWTSINNSILSSRRYFDYTLPLITGSKMRFRITRDTMSHTGEAPFTIMTIPQGINIDWACKDSFSVAWNPVPGAEGYIVYRLGNYYMDSLGFTTQTSFIISGVNQNDTYWVSVAALGPGQALSRRAIAVPKTPGIWNCVFPVDATTEIISPAPGIHPSCIDHSAVPVKVKIINKGSGPISNIPVSFSLNYSGTMTATYTDTLLPGQSDTLLMSGTLNLPLPGNYIITAKVEHPEDSNYSNNTFESRIRIMQGGSLTSGSTETFESLTSCSVISDCDFTCNIGGSWYNEENATMDDADWRVIQAITPTNGTGPIGDHTTLDGNGKFLYVQASGDCHEKKALLISPCMDLSQMQSPVLEFWYNMFGADMGSLHIDLLIGAEWKKDIIPVVSGNQGQAWKKGMIDLGNYAGSKVAVRFRAVTGNGDLSDIALDDVLLSDAASVDEHHAAALEVRAYPNPARDRLNIAFTLSLPQTFTLMMRDMAGKVLYEDQISGVQGDNLLQLPLEDIANGTYILSLVSGQYVAQQKLMIHK